MLEEKCDFCTQKVREHKNKLIHSHVGRTCFAVAQQSWGLLHTAFHHFSPASQRLFPGPGWRIWPLLHTLTLDSRSCSYSLDSQSFASSRPYLLHTASSVNPHFLFFPARLSGLSFPPYARLTHAWRFTHGRQSAFSFTRCL